MGLELAGELASSRLMRDGVNTWLEIIGMGTLALTVLM
jgi:hypothetical protein